MSDRLRMWIGWGGFFLIVAVVLVSVWMDALRVPGPNDDLPAWSCDGKTLHADHISTTVPDMATGTVGVSGFDSEGRLIWFAANVSHLKRVSP